MYGDNTLQININVRFSLPNTTKRIKINTFMIQYICGFSTILCDIVLSNLHQQAPITTGLSSYMPLASPQYYKSLDQTCLFLHYPKHIVTAGITSTVATNFTCGWSCSLKRGRNLFVFVFYALIRTLLGVVDPFSRMQLHDDEMAESIFSLSRLHSKESVQKGGGPQYAVYAATMPAVSAMCSQARLSSHTSLRLDAERERKREKVGVN